MAHIERCLFAIHNFQDKIDTKPFQEIGTMDIVLEIEKQNPHKKDYRWKFSEYVSHFPQKIRNMEYLNRQIINNKLPWNIKPSETFHQNPRFSGQFYQNTGFCRNNSPNVQYAKQFHNKLSYPVDENPRGRNPASNVAKLHQRFGISMYGQQDYTNRGQ